MDVSFLAPVRERLNNHSVYGALQRMDDLRRFMAHHVFSVWDFMSLAKTLQGHIAPAAVPWLPFGDPSVRRFINEIILEEESDIGLPDGSGGETYASHFELYIQAMAEVGVGAEQPLAFIELVKQVGIDQALAQGDLPEAARTFMKTTFGFIASGKPHVVAAAFALGREHVIPNMFRAFLARMSIGRAEAPAFHYYLERHIHLDETSHAPLSLKMLEELCGGDPLRLREAQDAAAQAVEARIAFWSGVERAIAEAR